MDADRTEWVPLPGIRDTDQAERAVVHQDGIGRARRVSNWTAAALIVSTGAAALALAHQALPATAPAAGTATAGTAAPGTGPGSPAGVRGPAVTHSVATTSASGVTTTTTTQTVNGKTVVTQVRNAPARGDS
jgi:hypothetical protein